MAKKLAIFFYCIIIYKKPWIIAKNYMTKKGFDSMFIQNTDQTLSLPTPIKSFSTYKSGRLSRKMLAIDVDYSIDQLVKIFSHGLSNYKIWFLNRKKKLCVIDNAENINGKICLSVTIDVYKAKTKTYMSLDKFLYLVEIGDFVISNTKFKTVYMKPYFAANKFKV